MQKKLRYIESEFMDFVLLMLRCLLVRENIIKDRLRHEDIETTLGTHGHLYPNNNFEVANKLNGIITFKQAEQKYDPHQKINSLFNNLRKQKQKVQ